jgi:hypothetical protein
LGTPLLFYMYVAPPFSHACSAFAVALFTWVWLRVREWPPGPDADRREGWTPAGMVALGAAGALMVMTREQDVFFGLAVAIDYVWAGAGGPGAGRRVRGALAAVVSFVIVYSPQLAAYRVINGHFGPHASVSNKMHWWAPHAVQVLLSPEHGFFVWTPLALIGIAGVVLMGSRRRERAVLFLMVALQLYVGGSVESWTVAGGFGQRRLIALTTVLVIGYAALWTARKSRFAQSVLVGVTVLAVYWNVALTAEFATGLMDRQKLEPARNAYDAFVTLPKSAPSLAYRYLFDRSSFYKPR